MPLPRNDDGNLISHAWPGAYPVMYLDHESNTLCPACARASDTTDELESFRPHASFIHWEGPDVSCDTCGTLIPSAYGDPGD